MRISNKKAKLGNLNLVDDSTLQYLFSPSIAHPCYKCGMNLTFQPMVVLNQQLLCCRCLSEKKQHLMKYQIISSISNCLEAKKLAHQLQKLSLLTMEDGNIHHADQLISQLDSYQSVVNRKQKQKYPQKRKHIKKIRNKKIINKKTEQSQAIKDQRIKRMQTMRYNRSSNQFEYCQDNLQQMLLAEYSSSDNSEELQFLNKRYKQSKQQKQKKIQFVKSSDILLKNDEVNEVKQSRQIRALRLLEKQQKLKIIFQKQSNIDQ